MLRHKITVFVDEAAVDSEVSSGEKAVTEWLWFVGFVRVNSRETKWLMWMARTCGVPGAGVFFLDALST